MTLCSTEFFFLQEKCLTFKLQLFIQLFKDGPILEKYRK